MSDEWDKILDPDEHIIWQGRPDGRFRFKPSMIFTLLFGAAFAGFALIWMILASVAGGFFWMFGLLHFCVGIGIGLGPFFKGGFIRRRTWYSLSNKRAYIATKLPFMGRNLKTYPIGPGTPITFEHDILPSVYFSSKSGRRNNKTEEIPIGFEMIEDGQHVLRLIEDIQKGAIPPPPP